MSYFSVKRAQLATPFQDTEHFSFNKFKEYFFTWMTIKNPWKCPWKCFTIILSWDSSFTTALKPKPKLIMAFGRFGMKGFFRKKRVVYMGSSKKSCSKGIWTAWSKRNFCNGILGQRTISVQIFQIFGCHQNHGY